jgi:hypothetical protein
MMNVAQALRRPRQGLQLVDGVIGHRDEVKAAHSLL